MDELLACPVCLDNYCSNNPPILLVSCKHNVCMNCARAIHQQSNSLPCPKCRVVTHANVVDRSLINHELMAIADVWVNSRATSSTATPPSSNASAEIQSPVTAATAATTPPASPTGLVEISAQGARFEDGELWVNVSLNPPADGEQAECMFIAMLDVSASMNTEAALPDNTEAQGFSRLDLVKHSMNTIVSLLTEKQQLCIIAFSSAARLVLPPTKMNVAGRQRATSVILSLTADGGTNIWDALRVALDITANQQSRNVNTALLLLTDGEPNINPPMGIVPTLKMMLDDFEDNPAFSISTFGFGYQLDTKLLHEIATFGAGSYGYIPDCSMVGTIFVNFMSNILASAIRNANIKIFDSATARTPIVSKNLGTVQFGQQRNILTRVSDIDNPLHIKLQYNGRQYELQCTIECVALDSDRAVNLIAQHAKFSLITAIQQAMNGTTKINLPTARQAVTSIKESIERLLQQHNCRENMFLQSLVLDIESSNEHGGQIMKALSRMDWFNRWGLNFLLSFVRAHSLEQCTNFKDKSLQLYGGSLFRTIQTQANRIFCSLPPPVQSCRETQSYGSQASPSRATAIAPAPIRAAKQQTPVRNMRAFMNASGGCFDGDGLVDVLYDNTSRPEMKKVHVRDLKRGDRVLTGENTFAEVECVVETQYSQSQCETVNLIDIQGVKLTAWHPIRFNGYWLFPNQLAKRSTTLADTGSSSLYNLILRPAAPGTDARLQQRAGTVLINGTVVVTLAHGLSEGILEHAYFGTEQVVNAIQSNHAAGWAAGHVVISYDQAISNLKRDSEGRVACYF